MSKYCSKHKRYYEGKWEYEFGGIDFSYNDNSEKRVYVEWCPECEEEEHNPKKTEPKTERTWCKKCNRALWKDDKYCRYCGLEQR